MKNAILFLFVAATTISNAQNVILAGKITNPNSDSLAVSNSTEDFSHTIRLKKDGTFRDTFSMKEGFYYLNDGTERTQVYLKPNFDLSLTLDTKQFDETIVYKGKGANENNYLAKKALLEESFGKLNYYGYYGKLSESEFLKIADSLQNVRLDLFNKHKNEFDKEFAVNEGKDLEFEYQIKLADYEGMYRYIANDKDFKVSANYPNPFSNLNVSDEKLLSVENYLPLVEKYLRKKANEKIKDDSTQDRSLLFLDIVQKEVGNDNVKNELIYSEVKSELHYTKHLDSLYNIAKSLISDKKQLTEIAELYTQLKKIEKGEVSPVFTLNDINDKSVSLTNLKGKVVYIDIWATWCLPCMKEVPELQKLEEEFKDKNIAFVSICTWDTKERWEKMVAEKKLGGIQLFAPDEKIAFFQDYVLNGVPHFILIDKDGKIVDANAERPSDVNIREQLKSLL